MIWLRNILDLIYPHKILHHNKGNLKRSWNKEEQWVDLKVLRIIKITTQLVVLAVIVDKGIINSLKVLMLKLISFQVGEIPLKMKETLRAQMFLKI